ncbi:hypothetical protein KP509_08G029200 [Ceratopteris richardii]|uniref:Reverse transcriptase domain-containing protein n=1 Tax=Ceratopteris richardii TaxID=49495 RepID=A0A8T2UBZ8_CERRI|nr:hypothetical protein KP509_08G029200 [Ceratopteris richardii]
MSIDATMLLSDHNPLLINLCDSHWELNIPKNLRKIPLRLNHAWLQTSVFKSKVHDLIQQVLSLQFPACMKWETLVVGMQEVIRECGKYFTVTLAKARVEAERVVFCMTEKVDSGLILSEAEYVQLCDAYRCLQVTENNAIQCLKVQARCSEVNDLHASSKCFFDFLRAKRLKDTITLLEVDGVTFRDGKSIAAACTQHFKDLFAASFKTDDAWFSSLQDALAFTPQILDTYMAAACEKGITEEEVLIALQSLKNGKALGLDGITKEFVVAFWSSLKTLVVDVCNEIWRDQRMPYSFKLGKIKLIPKVEMPKRLGDWRPITMMSIIYKIFAKIFALRLKPIIHKVVHPLQTGFINGRSIYDNIFFTQILMEHAVSSNQQIVGMQIDFEKAFDRVRWDFIAIVLRKLGFGVKFSRLSDSFPIERSMSQGCPLSPLFYALASSPMFFLLEAKMRSYSIHGISVFGTQQIAVGFADDTFIFAKAEHENVQNIIEALKPFSNVSGLRINMKKSALIDISARHFHSFIWEGPKIEKGTIFRYLGYPFGSNVSTKDKIEWFLNRVRSRLKNFLWNKRHNTALVLSAWEFICQPKLRGGLGILHLHMHLQARRVAFILRISVLQKPLWTEVFWKFIDNAQLHYKASWNLDPWNKIFLHAPKAFAVGSAYRSKWIQLVLFLQQFQIPLSIDTSDPWRDWLFAKHTKWWDGNASTFYSSLLPPQTIAEQCNARWGFKKLPSWWHARFHMRVFMWRVFKGHFTLGAFLSKHGMQGVCFPHCASYVENMRHAFWTCKKIQRWWTNLFLFPIWDVKPTKFNSTFLLFASGNDVLDRIRMACVYLLFWDIWMLRNGKVFRNKISAPSFIWNFCKAKIRLQIDVMPSHDRQAFISFLDAV